MIARVFRLLAVLVPFLAAACATPQDVEQLAYEDDYNNPFLWDMSNQGKDDTAYLNPDGIEAEVDIEADVTAPASRIREAPAELAQYALTYLRKHREFYLESLAEDVTSQDRVEWKVDSKWITAAAAQSVATRKLTHFRIRQMNAVLLNGEAASATVGKIYDAEVPKKPYTTYADAGTRCADPDDHMGLDQSIYWYQWNPDLSSCTLATQMMKVKLTKKFAVSKKVYPEFDKLVSDGLVTIVILFGQIDDGAVSDDDPGFDAMKTMAGWLKRVSFKEVTGAPVGRRFEKTINGKKVQVDLYSPRDFAGLDDDFHFPNFQKAISQHEILAYDGHSMLGASDFWARPTYPSFYQVFLYGGCLGYEYYVRPILHGKGGWAKLDIMSSVVEVSANANEFAGPWLSKFFWALSNSYKADWKSFLTAVRSSVGDSTFGAAGVRDNCFNPTGNVCSN
jgi:hypothetical protein